MLIEVGKSYCNSRGIKIDIVGTLEGKTDGFKFIGIVRSIDNRVLFFKEEGSASYQHENIIDEWIDPIRATGYGVYYSNGNFIIYDNLQAAQGNLPCNWDIKARLIKVRIEELPND